MSLDENGSENSTIPRIVTANPSTIQIVARFTGCVSTTITAATNSHADQPDTPENPSSNRVLSTTNCRAIHTNPTPIKHSSAFVNHPRHGATTLGAPCPD